MTTLATHAVNDPDQLALIADDLTPLGRLFADKFRDACEAEARIDGFWHGAGDHGPAEYVNPNAVRARLLDDPDYEPRQYAALWSASSGRDGYLEKTDRLVQISGEGSRGNTNKSTFWRRWVA